MEARLPKSKAVLRGRHPMLDVTPLHNTIVCIYDPCTNMALLAAELPGTVHCGIPTNDQSLQPTAFSCCRTSLCSTTNPSPLLPDPHLLHAAATYYPTLASQR